MSDRNADGRKAVQELTDQVLSEPGGARKLAEANLDGGMYCLIRAFNLTDDPDHGYAFAADVRARATAMLKGVYALFHESKIKPRSTANGESDPSFQRFMARASGEEQIKGASAGLDMVAPLRERHARQSAVMKAVWARRKAEQAKPSE